METPRINTDCICCPSLFNAIQELTKQRDAYRGLAIDSVQDFDKRVYKHEGERDFYEKAVDLQAQKLLDSAMGEVNE